MSPVLLAACCLAGTWTPATGAGAPEPIVVYARYDEHQSQASPFATFNSAAESAPRYRLAQQPWESSAAPTRIDTADAPPRLDPSSQAMPAYGQPNYALPAHPLPVAVPQLRYEPPVGYRVIRVDPAGTPTYAWLPTVTSGVVAYRPVLVGPPAGTYKLGKGMLGQPKLYVTGQPLRNALRWIGP